MKKAIALTLALFLCLSLCACNNSENEIHEEVVSTGTWSIEENNVILTFGNNVLKNFSFSRDEGETKSILVGPQAGGGFTYYSYTVEIADAD